MQQLHAEQHGRRDQERANHLSSAMSSSWRQPLQHEPYAGFELQVAAMMQHSLFGVQHVKAETCCSRTIHPVHTDPS